MRLGLGGRFASSEFGEKEVLSGGERTGLVFSFFGRLRICSLPTARILSRS